MKSTAIYKRIFLSFFLTLTACSSEKDTVVNLSVDDRWDTAAAEAQNLDGNTLAQMLTLIDAGTFGEIHSLLILRNDSLVIEEYFHDYDRSQLHTVYSVTKSVTSALIGIALEQGKIQSTDEKLLGFFPEYNVANHDASKDAITLENILTMTAGFAWDEWSIPYGEDNNDATRLFNSDDWMAYMLNLPMNAAPGSRFAYSSGNTMLLSGVLGKSTGTSAETFADVHLFLPLGITNWEWATGPNGITNTGWGLRLQPIDMAKFGSLFLHNGRVGDKQVVPEEWVSLSTHRHVSTTNGFDYGYQWWRFRGGSDIANLLRTNDAFFAWGYGGQFVFVFPHLNLVVVTTAGNFTDSSPAFRYLRDYILQAVKDR